MKNILMVCLGNICRSPLAEGIFKHQAREIGLNATVDSCGTANYHVGEAPDRRSIAKASEYGINIANLRGRQFNVSDFDEFDHILVMDHANYDNVCRLARNSEDINKVSLILSHHPENREEEVPDPYYGGEEGFEQVYQLLNVACRHFINQLMHHEK